MPGQSIEDEIDRQEDDILTYTFYPLIFIVFGVVLWIDSLLPKSTDSGSVPSFVSWAIFLVFLGYCIYRVYKARKTIERLKMARDGERMVAEELQKLLKDGAAVIHDIVGEKFNIDHVVISRQGVFLIETKTYSKPIDSDAKISFEGDHIFVDGQKIDREPIKQAKSLSKWLQELLLKTTGKKFPIHPVVLFPGWFTEPTKRGQEVWVLNPKALPKFIANEPLKIKDTDVHLIAYHLSRYVRANEMSKSHAPSKH